MAGATITRQYQPHGAVRYRGKLIAALLLLVIAGGLVAVYLLRRAHALPPKIAASMDAAGWPAWMTQKTVYPPQPAPLPAAAPIPEDPNAARWAQIQREMAEQRAMLEEMKRHPVKPEKPAAKPEKPKYASMLCEGCGTLAGHPATPQQAAGATNAATYDLAPGATKIPCQVETAMNSDVDSIFTAKTRVAVFDTETGQHLLIPQNSTILGKYHSGNLLFGNERLPTVSMSLTVGAASYDLGEAPVLDQQGVAGLSGRVNTHFWRLASAVLITGALRGGAQMVPQVLAGAGPAATVGTSIAQQSGQTVGQVQGRSMDTRPTIEVDAGQLCTVILLKPLSLPEVRL